MQPQRYAGTSLVFAGGGVGALLRYLLDEVWGPVGGFALDIFLINMVGAFVLAFLVGWTTGAGEPTRDQLRLRLFLGTGLMGGFTTYSTLAVEVAHSIGDGRWAGALAYSLGTVLVGSLFSVAGLFVGRRGAQMRRLGAESGELW